MEESSSPKDRESQTLQHMGGICVADKSGGQIFISLTPMRFTSYGGSRSAMIFCHRYSAYTSHIYLMARFVSEQPNRTWQPEESWQQERSHDCPRQTRAAAMQDTWDYARSG
jgi:hypothetical protein